MCWVFLTCMSVLCFIYFSFLFREFGQQSCILLIGILWHFVYLLELLSVNSVKRQTTVIHLSFVDSQTVCSAPKILLIGYHVICFYLMVQIFGVFLQENCSDLRPDEAAWHVCRLDPSVFYSWWGQCHSPCMHIITTSILTAVFRWTSVSWVYWFSSFTSFGREPSEISITCQIPYCHSSFRVSEYWRKLRALTPMTRNHQLALSCLYSPFDYWGKDRCCVCFKDCVMSAFYIFLIKLYIRLGLHAAFMLATVAD